LAYLIESQDDTLADSFQVETLTNLPVLGMIPFHRMEVKPREGALAAESSPFLIAPESATAEAFRSLRSGLTLSGVGRKLKVLSITSALPGEGKSYTVYNLGLHSPLPAKGCSSWTLIFAVHASTHFFARRAKMD